MYSNIIFGVKKFLDNKKVQIVLMSLLWSQVIKTLLAQQFTNVTTPSAAQAILLEAAENSSDLASHKLFLVWS